jgi:death-on-curing protein
VRFLTLGETLALHRRVLTESGGRAGIRDFGAIVSAVAQPYASVGGHDAYPTLIEKTAAIGYALVRNHGFIDGNKRVAHAAMEALLMLNGAEIVASVDEQERFMLALATGMIPRSALVTWLRTHVVTAS